MGFLTKPRQSERLLDLWDDFFEDSTIFNRLPQLKSNLAPVDLESDEENVYVTTELPGIAKDKLNVEYDNGVLYISGEKEDRVKRNENNRVYQEISRGKIERRIQVGDIDFDAAEATFKDGHLELVLPKQKASSVKRLTIK